MMLKLTAISLILALITVTSLAAPYQELVPKPGHVAVYIREGDTPLSEIHPKLAEAFKEEPLPLIEIVPEISSDVQDTKEDLKQKEEQNATIPKNDDSKVDEVTASDIAEFDDVIINKAEGE